VTTQARTVRVAVSAAAYAFDRPYSYLLPESMGYVRPGCRVLVPFGRGNRPVEGIVLAIRQEEPSGPIKVVQKALDAEPVLDAGQLRLALWMHKRFFCTVYDAVKAILPAGVWYRIETVYRLSDGLDRERALNACESDKERLLVETVCSHGGSCELEELQGAFGEYDALPTLKGLVKSGVLTLEGSEKRRVRDKEIVYASLAVPVEDAQQEVLHLKRSAKMQASLLDLLCSIGRAPAKELCAFTGASMPSLQALVTKELVVLERETVYRRPIEPITERQPIPELTEGQYKAYLGLCTDLNAPDAKAALLFGVTGSGKTTVYLHLIRDVLEEGKSAILLVPEISLTPQMIQTFSACFGDTVAVLHSRLSIGERYDEWKRIRKGDARVVIGTRSAVFAPVQELGLLILDEEQEETYKSENNPRYHAREVAKFRCVEQNALLLLGSATPDVVSRYHAQQGRYHYYELPGRYNEQALPTVQIVDLKKELRLGNSGSVSSILQSEIEENLRLGEQSILFLNRRGTSKLVTCGDCGYIYECPRCSVSLTYHQFSHSLQCHHCGYRRKVDERCPSCAGELRYVGDGTEKVEQELHALFPGVETLRMDADTISLAGSHERILSEFREKKIPILIGTQMVTKGLNFENVTLVGVLLADQSLYSGDHRANERTFSLITQVVGRGGRGDRPGRAVIQTFTPENQTILQAAKQDYPGFYESEIALRKMHGTPPFSEILTITVSGMNESSVLKGCVFIRDYLKHETQGSMQILGPAPLPVVRVMNRFRYRVTIYAPEGSGARMLAANIVKYCSSEKQFRDLSVFADDDPYN